MKKKQWHKPEVKVLDVLLTESNNKLGRDKNGVGSNQQGGGCS